MIVVVVFVASCYCFVFLLSSIQLQSHNHEFYLFRFTYITFTISSANGIFDDDNDVHEQQIYSFESVLQTIEKWVFPFKHFRQWSNALFHLNIIWVDALSLLLLISICHCSNTLVGTHLHTIASHFQANIYCRFSLI